MALAQGQPIKYDDINNLSNTSLTTSGNITCNGDITCNGRYVNALKSTRILHEIMAVGTTYTLSNSVSSYDFIYIIPKGYYFPPIFLPTCKLFPYLSKENDFALSSIGSGSNWYTSFVFPSVTTIKIVRASLGGNTQIEVEVWGMNL